MSLTTTFLFDHPQAEIASLISRYLRNGRRASIVVGFATDDGLSAIEDGMRADPGKLETFVLGAATLRGYEAMEGLHALGVPLDRLFVHLGHTQRSGTNGFAKFHPMMHSKIYLIDLPDGRSAAFVGSHNLTSFALRGLNAEASILVEGPSDHAEFHKIRAHIAAVRAQAAAFDPAKTSAFSWWTAQYLEGLRKEVNAGEDDAENRRTFLLLATCRDPALPKRNERIYFEVPEALRLTSLVSEVHLFLFDSMTISPTDMLGRLDQAKARFHCSVVGLEMGGGGLELDAQWEIGNGRPPDMIRTGRTVRPATRRDMQQIRISVKARLSDRFHYLFDPKREWEPVYGDEVPLRPQFAGDNFPIDSGYERDPGGWTIVRDLVEASPRRQRRKREEALRFVSPESGNFGLLSYRRINLDTPEGKIVAKGLDDLFD